MFSCLFGKQRGQFLLVEQGGAFGLFGVNLDVFLASGCVTDVPENIGVFHPMGDDVAV